MSTHYLTALEQAQSTYTNREHLEKQDLFDSAVELAEWGIFSRRAIARITGLRPDVVLKLAPKSDRSGGRFDPETIPHLIELIHMRRRGEMNIFAAADALKGTSSYFAAAVTGIPRTTLHRWALKAEELEAA